MPIVTIRGPLGGGAGAVGRAVASIIGAEYVDRELIAAAAASLTDGDQHDIGKAAEGGIWDRITKGLQDCWHSMFDVSGLVLPTAQMPLEDTRHLNALLTVVRELAEHPNIVIRGRAGPFILKEHPRAFHVMITASPEVRIRRVARWLGAGWRTAAQRVKHEDDARRAFISRYFGEEVDDPSHYDLVVRTDRLDVKPAAKIITDALAAWLAPGDAQPTASAAAG